MVEKHNMPQAGCFGDTKALLRPCQACLLSGWALLSLFYLQLLHEVAEHVAQLLEEDFSRLLPPPIPNEENIFCMSLLPQAAQETVFSFPTETRLSKCFPHFLQINSYIGMTELFYIIFSDEKRGGSGFIF